jgi:hypothetical protein
VLCLLRALVHSIDDRQGAKGLVQRTCPKEFGSKASNKTNIGTTTLARSRLPRSLLMLTTRLPTLALLGGLNSSFERIAEMMHTARLDPEHSDPEHSKELGGKASNKTNLGTTTFARSRLPRSLLIAHYAVADAGFVEGLNSSFERIAVVNAAIKVASLRATDDNMERI